MDCRLLLCSRVTIDARSALSSVILVITLLITLLAKSHKPLSRNARFAEPQRNRIADCHRDACMGVADNGEDPLSKITGLKSMRLVL